MAKGQLRSNREAKKPKQTKKPSVPASTFAGTLQRSGGSEKPEAKKK